MRQIYCSNNSKDSKYFSGKICNNKVEVGDSTENVLCWACLVRLMGNPEPVKEIKKKSGFPRGWQFMVEFVDKEGNVYHKGDLQPALKGTKQPTKVKETVKKIKPNKTVNFDKIKDLKKKIKNEPDLKKKRRLQQKLDQYLQEF